MPSNFTPDHPAPDAERPDRSEWVECPKCRSAMFPLQEYDLQNSSGFLEVETEVWEPALWD